MPLVRWNDSLSVKVGQFDSQHKKLFDMINDLHEAMKSGRSNDLLSSLLDGLYSYTRTHFTLEEKYFEQYSYPEKESQARQHRHFEAKILEFKKKLEQKKLGLSIEVMNFLSDWLVNHIQIHDKKYSEFFAQKGVS